ncbi:MAG: hypothetical protein WC889_20280, partial [Myxococcota bacterium]
MKTLQIVFLAAITVMLMNGCSKPPPDAKASPKPLSDIQEPADTIGLELVKKLIDEKTRAKAFYELWRRGNAKEDKGYDEFVKKHYDPEVVVCPQGDGKPPLYAVLYGFLEKNGYVSDEDYELPNPSELFPPDGSHDKPRTRREVEMAVFTSEGKHIFPFGCQGDKVLSGFQIPSIFDDINGDGLVELAEPESYEVGDNSRDHAEILHVSRLKPDQEPIFAVIYNWGEWPKNMEWTYRFTGPNKEGIYDLELGPKIVGGMKPKVVFKWDRKKMAYTGPVWKAGDHFRVISVTTETQSEINRLKKTGLTFPNDPDFVDERRMESWAEQGR